MFKYLESDFPEDEPDLTDFIFENDPSEFRLSPTLKLAEPVI